jgi:hypothetical protein
VASALLLLFLARAAQLWVGHVGCEQTWDDGATQLARAVHYHARGAALYSDFRQPPYYALEYGPTIPILAAPLTRLFGPSIFACLRAGRWLTIAATFAAYVLMFVLARRFSSAPAAAIAVIGFALTPVFFPWFSEFRVDMPALLLELAGLCAFSVGGDLLALALFVLAFMTKQTYLAGIAAAVGLCWLRAAHGRALKLAAGWSILAAIGIATVQWRSPFFLLNTMASHVPLWDPAAPPQLLVGMLLAMAPLAVLAVAGLRHRTPAIDLVIAYAIAALASCGVLALRWGSDFNYFMEFAAALSLMAAAGIDLVLAATASSGRIRQAAAGVALAVILAAPAVVTKKLALRSLLVLDFRPPTQSCDTGWNPAAFLALARTDGPILTAIPDISLRLDRQVWAPEFDVLGAMQARGLFDDRELISFISHKKVAAIVLGPEGLDAEYRERSFFWPQLRAAIVRNYALAPSGSPPYLMLPKS